MSNAGSRWSELGGKVTRSFDDYLIAMKDVSAFTRVVLQFTRPGYERTYAEAEDEANRRWEERTDEDSEPTHPIEIAMANVSNLYPSDLEWMLLSGAIKDAVTVYEIYLEKALQEALHRHGWQLDLREGTTLRWNETVGLYEKLFGLVISTPEVEQVRDLRHILTHRRGELRTEQDRATFGKSDDPFRIVSLVAHLKQEDVERHIAVLAQSVQSVDPLVWAVAWGSARGTLSGTVHAAISEDKKIAKLIAALPRR